MLLDYETLRVIWWLLLGILLVGFAVMDGFDLGVGILLHRVARTDNERRIVLNTVGPVWEGNQIWLILGGGAIFAAWPTLYAVSFSLFYFAMLLVLFGLILRPVGFKYRSKIANPRWRMLWDLGIFLGGLVPALIFGVAIGNVLQGLPFYFDPTMRAFYTGSFIALLNPFALLCGLLSVSMLTMHGGAFLGIKTTGDVQRRAGRHTHLAALLTILLFALAGYCIMHGIPGYTLTSVINPEGPSNPLHKDVMTQTAAWLQNYHHYPTLLLVPALGFTGALLAMLLTALKRYHLAWIGSALSIVGIIATVGASMFPFILPSSENPAMSLTVWDASSSQLTLFIMLIATIIFVPIIIAYTSWVYYVLRGKVTEQYVRQNTQDIY